MSQFSAVMKSRYGGDFAMAIEEILLGLIMAFPELAHEISNNKLLLPQEFSDFDTKQPGKRCRIFQAINEVEHPSIINVYDYLKNKGSLDGTDYNFMRYCLREAMSCEVIAQDYTDCCRAIRENHMALCPKFYTDNPQLFTSAKSNRKKVDV